MMLDYFCKLGEHLERAWDNAGRDEDSFSDVAAAALRALPPDRDLDLEKLVDAVLDPAVPAPLQLAPPGVFGQPGVTVFRGRGYLVEVYFWQQSISAIHDHPFCGAFTVLQGFSVEAVYRFATREDFGPRARLGSLSLESLALVEAGHVGVFGQRKHALIHALLHVQVPTVSLVVRTERADGYLRYFPPGVALAMDSPAETFERPMQLLDTLRVSGAPSYPRRFEAFLRNADFETAFRILSRTWFRLTEPERETWLKVAREHHGKHVDMIRQALERAEVDYAADMLRQRLMNSDQRFIATALLLADNRRELLGLLAARHPDPLERLHRFVDEPGVFAADEAASAMIAHVLIDGGDAGEAVNRLVAVFGREAISGREEEIRAFHTACAFACCAA
jgi:hypothetical protein